MLFKLVPNIKMSKQFVIIKKNKQVFILSDGSSYYDHTISLKNQSNYTLLNQDFNNHFFWIHSTKSINLTNNIKLLGFRTKYI